MMNDKYELIIKLSIITMRILVSGVIFVIIINSCNLKNNSVKKYDFNNAEFRSELRNELSNRYSYDKERAIKNIKLYNTLLFYELKSDSVYLTFRNYFERNETEIISKLRCGYGLGMTTVCEDSLNIGSYYSRKSIYVLEIEPPHDGRERILLSTNPL